MTLPFEDRFATLGELRLHWLEWGDRDGCPMLLVHGARSSAHGTWDATVPDLVAGRRLIAPDHRGHGESAWDPEARYTTSSYLADLEQVVDHLGLGRFDLVGHSLGGRVGLFYAAAHPDRVRRLVVVDYGPSVRPRSVPASFRDPQPLDFASREEAEAYVRDRFPEAARRRSLGYGLVDRPDGRVSWRADVEGLAKSWGRRAADPLDSAAEWAAVRSLATPTLVLRGGRSTLIGDEDAAALAGAADLVRVVDYPDAGHWLHQDEPERFAADVLGFLDSGQSTVPDESPPGA
jgi:pimeloyl-ACP methyl ester carboxylesterase